MVVTLNARGMKFLTTNFPMIAALAALFFARGAFGAEVTVLVAQGTNDLFVPAVTNIAVNDRVIWAWTSANHHSTTSGTNGVHGDDNGVPSGLWDSGTIITLPHTFTNTFTTAGNYLYYCTTHFSFAMTGAVMVAGANVAPTVSITNPASGAVFAAPANVTVQASASDSDGSVTNVQFLVGPNFLANVSAPPFFATTNNLAAGNYTLSAIVADNLGATSTNSVNISVVTPATIVLTGAGFSGTNFQLNYSANVGLNYVVQRSTNLAPANWISLFTNIAGSNPVVFVDTNATGSSDFYRVGRIPNP